MKQKKETNDVLGLDDVLRIIRIANDIKTQDLAFKLGVSPSYISQIENGSKKPNMELLKKYADTFSIPLSAILKAQEVHNKETTQNEKFSTKIFRIMKTIEAWGGLSNSC